MREGMPGLGLWHGLKLYGLGLCTYKWINYDCRQLKRYSTPSTPTFERVLSSDSPMSQRLAVPDNSRVARQDPRLAC